MSLISFRIESLLPHSISSLYLIKTIGLPTGCQLNSESHALKS